MKMAMRVLNSLKLKLRPIAKSAANQQFIKTVLNNNYKATT